MLRNFFNSNLKSLFERESNDLRNYRYLHLLAALDEGGIALSLADGIVFKGLRVRPSGLNAQLEVTASFNLFLSYLQFVPTSLSSIGSLI